MSTLNVNTINPVQANEPLNFQTGGTTFVQLTTAGVLSGVGATAPTISNFNGLGKVLQVVQTYVTDHVAASQTTATNIPGLSANITPSSTSSKVLVNFSIFMNSADSNGVFANLCKDGSTLGPVGDATGSSTRATVGQGEVNATGSFTPGGGHCTFQYLDSPNTTSEVIYHVQAWTSSGTLYVGRAILNNSSDSPSVPGQITAMEIAG